ncbi:MAG: hypothetical protein ACREJO_18195, partial [Phycisphaerales bacterium]
PADPYAINFTKDLEQIATEQDRYLVGSSYCYSQSFWVKPEAFGVAAPEFLRTGNINGVLHPSKKVVVWEATDCKPREPMFYPALAARPMVMLVDGSVLEQSIEDLTLREASAGLRPPTKFALTGSLGKYECNPPEPPDAPDPPLGLPGYFAYTAGGILGRDIP